MNNNNNNNNNNGGTTQILRNQYAKIREEFANEDYSTGTTFLKFILFIAIVGYTVLVLFPISFLNGSDQWKIYDETWAGDLFEVIILLGSFGFFFFAMWMAPSFLTTGFLTDLENLSSGVRPRLDAIKTQFKENMRRAFQFYIICLILAIILDNVTQWTWLVDNSQFIPNSVGDKVLDAPRPGAAVPNTRRVGEEQFIRFDYIQVVAIFTRSMVIISAVNLLLRLQNIDSKMVKEGKPNEITGKYIEKWDLFATTGYVMYMTMFGIGLTFTMFTAGRQDDIYIQGIGAGYTLVVVSFIAHLGFFINATRNFSYELHWRFVTAYLFVLFWLTFLGLYLIYVWNTVRHGHEFRGGQLPKFDGTKPPSGQSNYFLYTTDIAILMTASIPWTVQFGSLVIYEAFSDIIEVPAIFVSLNRRAKLQSFWKWLSLGYTLILMGFLLNELYGNKYLNTRWIDWTIATSIGAFVIWGGMAFIALAVHTNEQGAVQKSTLYAHISMFMSCMTNAGLWIWIVSYMARHYGDLGSSKSNAEISDPTNSLSVYWWTLLTTLLLILIHPVVNGFEYNNDRYITTNIMIEETAKSV